MVLGKDMHIQGLFAFVDGNRAKSPNESVRNL